MVERTLDKRRTKVRFLLGQPILMARTIKKKQQKPATKYFCQKEHTKQRAVERFGISLNKRKYQEIVGMIRGGQSQFVCAQSNRVSVHRLQYEGKEIGVVYDKQRKSIATLLTPEMLAEWAMNHEDRTVRGIIQSLSQGAPEYTPKITADI